MPRPLPLLAISGLILVSCGGPADTMTAAGGQAAATPRGTATAAATVTAEPVAADLPVAPDFTLRTLDGGTFSLAAKRGTPVVLNFWAPW